MTDTTVLTAARAEPRSILLVPFADGIGDFVNMLPIVEAVRARFSQAHLSIAASQHVRHLLDSDDIDVLTPSWLRRRTSPRFARYRWLIPQTWVAALSGVGLRSELGRFDLSINLFKVWERGMRFDRDWTPQVPSRPDPVHSLDFLAAKLRAWDVDLPPARRKPRIIVTEGSAAWAERQFVDAGLVGRPVVGLVPASNMAIKQWPIRSWARLNDALARRGILAALFLPERQHHYSRLVELAENAPAPIVGDLGRVAAALARCQLVIGVDTGLLHMAAAVGTPYVGLFGPTNPEVTGPYNRELGACLVAPYSKGPSCRGCWKSFKYEDDRCAAFDRGSCMGLLDQATVLEAALGLLNGHVAGDEAGSNGLALEPVARGGYTR